VAAVQSGRVDFAPDVPIREVARLDKMAALSGRIFPISRVILLQIRSDKAFADKNVRLAAHHAINKKAISQALYAGKAVPLSIVAPPGTPGYVKDFQFPYDPAKSKALLAKSDDWRHEAWGVPVSAAHLGLAISVFSKRLLDYSSLLGADFEEEERASVLDVWRYAGYVMGIPESILYTDGASAQRIYTVGFECEPLPDADSAIMANALIQAIPGVADITDPAEKEKVLDLAYRLSRALIGKRLADSFEYPRKSTVGTLFLFRARHRFQRLLKREHTVRSGNFTQLLQISAYDEAGLSYRLPDHVRASKSNPW